ncbi:UNVERIFIED_CONTAM: hypothetical protein Slati_3718400 [Sesamum latifolium]|uniref:Transposase n=1 Tax=Sesamum latifolium TaxID=2727402 RepID=A0AAW2U3N2_9LAMI
MRFDKRLLALIAVQQITIDIVVGLFILLYIIHMVMSRDNTRRRVRPRRYTLNSRIPDQIRNLHRLVSLSDSSCLHNLRMDRNAFGQLCYILEYSGGMSSTKHVTVAEQVAIFLSVVAHHKKNCVVKHNFLRSGRTVSKHFHVVLNTLYKMSHVFLAKATPVTDDCSDPRWRWFKGCLGALDGTFVDVRVREHEKGRYRTRKGQVAVNVLGVCNPNMQFIYVLSGWEGSAADSRVLRDAIHRPHGLRVPSENYYLCDNGYTNADGFLTPYCGVRYYLKEWDRSQGGPQSARELFKLKHSSARNVIERAFELLKVRWGILRSQSFYPIDTQNKIILVCCLLHNFLRNEMPDDPLELEIPDQHEIPDENIECISSIDTTTAWTSWRDQLASSMLIIWNFIIDMAIEAQVEDEGISRQKVRRGNKERSGTRRTWTVMEEEALINALKTLVVGGWKCENGFRNRYLAQLESHMQCSFPLSNIRAKPHIISKLHVWKKQYSILVTMMTKSGLGWDDSRCMVTVDDDNAWEDYVKTDPTAKGMRYKSWPFFPAWSEIFGKDQAQGGRTLQPPPPPTKDPGIEQPQDTQDCYVPTAEWNPDTGFVGQEEDPPLSYNLNVDPTMNSSSATKRTETSSKKRKAHESWPEIPQLVSMVTNFCDTANTRLGSLTRVLEKEFGDPNQRVTILDAVKQLPGLQHKDCLLVARRLVRDSKDMEFFFNLELEDKMDLIRLMLEGGF